MIEKPKYTNRVSINLEKYLNPLIDEMEFDIEFIVRWHWAGKPIVQIQTRVIYPKDGISHFNLFRDNLLISWMHLKLFFGMLKRLPILLKQKISSS